VGLACTPSDARLAVHAPIAEGLAHHNDNVPHSLRLLNHRRKLPNKFPNITCLSGWIDPRICKLRYLSRNLSSTFNLASNPFGILPRLANPS
jgi:hypothetical protein